MTITHRVLVAAVASLTTASPVVAQPTEWRAPRWTQRGIEAQTVPLEALVLQDVQGLFGGQSLWVSADRTAYVQLVGRRAGEPALWERRYKTTLTAEEWAEAERLIRAHHLLTVKMPNRPGVPDEAHPVITIVTRAGATTRIGKWANDKHPDFDPVYSFLIGLCRPRGTLIREGPIDWKWTPPGFDKV